MKKMAFIILLAVASLSYSQNQISPAKKAKIEKLLEVTGSLKIGATFGKAIVNQLYQSYKKIGTSIPDSVLTIMESEIGTVIDNEMKLKSGLVDQLIQIYDKYYTDKNLDDVLLFYGTETGKKVIATLPDIMQESMAVGQQWGTQKGADIVNKLIERMTKRGVKLPKI
jgi:uncharacterized protein